MSGYGTWTCLVWEESAIRTRKKRHRIKCSKLVLVYGIGGMKMSLHKAIASGKEHRVEYGTKDQPFCKSVDRTCRNHGGYRGGASNQCPWCLENRMYRTNKEKEKADNSLKEYQNEEEEI